MYNTNSLNGKGTSAKSAMSNFILTTDQNLKKTSDYEKVCRVIFRLMESGVTFAAKGYCISMSDIVYTLLNQVGIKCRIVECAVTINNKQDNKLYVVGYDNLKDVEHCEDTHVVVVTETEVPMIIDVSIAHLLPNNLQGIIDSLQNSEILANINTNFVDLTYKEKTNFKIPLLHQTSIVDRIKTDMFIFDNIKVLKSLVVIALLVSSFNAIRGLFEYYEVYVNSTNDWGPVAVKSINERLDKIEVMINEKADVVK